MALLFYAGHGVQVNGNNYMAPVDARLTSYNDLDFEAMPMDLILSAMERTTKVNLIFLDACRDSPFSQNLARSMGTRSGGAGRGLARLGTGVGTLIAFATQPGNVALDGVGRNSPFTTALLRHLGTPGQDITRDLVDVRRDVLEATGGKQVPWDNSSLTGEVVLQPLTGGRSVEAQANGGVELAYWETIKDKADRRFFEAYLKQYPKGVFAALAALRIEELAAALGRAAAADNAPATRAADGTTEMAALDTSTGSAASSTRLTGELDSVELARATQKELARLGCLAGDADGKWGVGSRKALQDYADRQGLKLASLEPAGEILERLRGVGGRVCPLVCGSGMEAKDGGCVPRASGLSAFNGAWRLVRRATTDCGGWRELSTSVLIREGIVTSSSGFAGNVSKNGSVNIKHTFVHQGKNGGNTITGVIKGDSGAGRFRGTGVGRGCSGKVIMERM
jgi:hypothetical protein